MPNTPSVVIDGESAGGEGFDYGYGGEVVEVRGR